MVTEDGLGNPFEVAQGMLIAAAPATILVLRIGRMGLSPRRIWLAGMAGVWIPIVTSVTLISLAKNVRSTALLAALVAD